MHPGWQNKLGQAGSIVLVNVSVGSAGTAGLPRLWGNRPAELFPSHQHGHNIILVNVFANIDRSQVRGALIYRGFFMQLLATRTCPPEEGNTQDDHYHHRAIRQSHDGVLGKDRMSYPSVHCRQQEKHNCQYLRTLFEPFLQHQGSSPPGLSLRKPFRTNWARQVLHMIWERDSVAV